MRTEGEASVLCSLITVQRKRRRGRRHNHKTQTRDKSHLTNNPEAEPTCDMDTCSPATVHYSLHDSSVFVRLLLSIVSVPQNWENGYWRASAHRSQAQLTTYLQSE